MRATMGGVLIAVTIAVTLLTSVANAQPTPDAQPTPQTPLPTATPAAPNTAPPPSPSQRKSKMANVQRLHARPGQLKGRRTRALGSYLEREARSAFDAISRCSINLAATAATKLFFFQEEMYSSARIW